jgi:hypothetical protein
MLMPSTPQGRYVTTDPAVTDELVPPRRASCCEIYNEMLYDLLNFTRTPLTERWDPDHGFTVPDLQRRECPTLEDMRKVTCPHRFSQGQGWAPCLSQGQVKPELQPCKCSRLVQMPDRGSALE